MIHNKKGVFVDSDKKEYNIIELFTEAQHIEIAERTTELAHKKRNVVFFDTEVSEEEIKHNYEVQRGYTFNSNLKW